MRGIPHYCVSLACLKDGKLEHAVIVDPVRREEFIASRGRGAQVNGHRVRVSNATELRESLLGTGIPFLGHEQEKAARVCRNDEHPSWPIDGYTSRGRRSPRPRLCGRWSSRCVLGNRPSNRGILPLERCLSKKRADSSRTSMAQRTT